MAISDFVLIKNIKLHLKASKNVQCLNNYIFLPPITTTSLRKCDTIKIKKQTLPTGQKPQNFEQDFCALATSSHMWNKDTNLAQSRVGSSSHAAAR